MSFLISGCTIFNAFYSYADVCHRHKQYSQVVIDLYLSCKKPAGALPACCHCLSRLIFRWEIIPDYRTDPVLRQVSQVVGQASRRIKCFEKVNASPKTFLRQAEKHKVMTSLPPSQVILCNEIVTVILINDLSYKVSRGQGIPQAISKDKQTRAETHDV